MEKLDILMLKKFFKGRTKGKWQNWEAKRNLR
jgi:hypothetical protein